MPFKSINGHRHVLYDPVETGIDQQSKKVDAFYQFMDRRRSVREFSDRPVVKEIIETLIRTASTAPSGAHKQPWTFCAISNREMKTKIRQAAEKEEVENYTSRMSERWKEDLKPFGTDASKPFLEIAPWIIVVFKQTYGIDFQGNKSNHYYVNESVGIACGLLIAAIHEAGLVTLTHTPSPMNFLTNLCHRPENERPFLLLPVGYPEKPTYVPDIRRKSLDEIAVFHL